MTEGKADEESLAHLFLSIGHILQSLLFVVYLLVLGHVSLIAEIVEITRICFRIELGDKGCFGLPQRLPVHFSKVLMLEYIFDLRETFGT